MKTLEEHNKEVLESNSNQNNPRLNGIKCPGCSKELMDNDPTFVMASNPPQVYIHCPSCGYKGRRYC